MSCLFNRPLWLVFCLCGCVPPEAFRSIIGTKTKFVGYLLEYATTLVVYSVYRMIRAGFKGIVWSDEARSPRDFLLAETARTWSYSQSMTAGWLHYRVRFADGSTSAQNSIA